MKYLITNKRTYQVQEREDGTFSIYLDGVPFKHSKDLIQSFGCVEAFKMNLADYPMGLSEAKRKRKMLDEQPFDPSMDESPSPHRSYYNNSNYKYNSNYNYNNNKIDYTNFVKDSEKSSFVKDILEAFFMVVAVIFMFIVKALWFIVKLLYFFLMVACIQCGNKKYNGLK